VLARVAAAEPEPTARREKSRLVSSVVGVILGGTIAASGAVVSGHIVAAGGASAARIAE
jgi:hypothetical protein